MNNLILKLGTTVKNLTIPRTNSVEDLSKIIESAFKVKQKIIGVTDDFGKFYDLQFVYDNMKILRIHQLQLVTAKDANDDNMSFASENNEIANVVKGNQKQQKQQQTLSSELFQKNTPGFLGFINDLPYFQQLLLQDKKLVIVVCSSKDKSNLKIPYNFYIYDSYKDNSRDSNKDESILIYYDHRKIGQLYIDDWKTLEGKIQAIIKNLYQYEKSKKDSEIPIDSNKNKVQQQFSEVDNINADNEMPTEQIKSTFLENLSKLRQQQTISELQYYKLKAKLFQNPEDFMRKYQMGTRQGFRKRKSIDELRDEIVRSKQQKLRYQTIINQFRDLRAPSREQNYNNRNYKNEIPIIVRKYNNVIQKISTSYPLNIQQEQAINLIMELELKGLISENDSRVYKSQILQEEPEIFNLFAEYFQESIDQIELTHRLKNKKSIQKKSLQQRNRSEQIVRMIIKYAKRNSFELLRNLAIEGNPYILKCYDQYLVDKSVQNFANSLQKVSNYYKTKSKFEKDFKVV